LKYKRKTTVNKQICDIRDGSLEVYINKETSAHGLELGMEWFQNQWNHSGKSLKSIEAGITFAYMISTKVCSLARNLLKQFHQSSSNVQSL
jgi:hypothetical protein